jgi:ATP-dependent Clp protease ATP-binding subunit ClpX
MPEYRCSFCGKKKDEVRNMLQGAVKSPVAYICNECVALCKKVVQDEDRKEAEAIERATAEQRLQRIRKPATLRAQRLGWAGLVK